MENDIRTSVMILAKGPGINPSMPPTRRQLIGPVVKETLGSCFLFTYQGKFCVATCRHVIDGQINSNEQCKVVIRYTTPNGRTDGTVISLDSAWLHYHPDDTLTQTYDIAIFVLPIKIASILPIQVWSLDNQREFPILDKSTKIRLVGYPINRMAPEMIGNRNIPLLLSEIQASIAAIPGKDIALQPNFPKHIIGTYAMEVDTSDIRLEGASGGLAVLETERFDLAFGIMSSVGLGTVHNNLTGLSRHISIVYVVPIIRLIETISQ